MSWAAGTVRHVLPNGLTLLAQRDPTAPVVAVVTHVKAGYFDEPDEWVGIAHVLEHMYFKGTARRGPGDIARETQLVGGYINAGTIYDKTVYYTVLPAAGDGLGRALDVQADALMHAFLDPDELARELEVIVQEAKRKLDTPSAVTVETLYATLFRVHRMRRWRIGTPEGLRRFTAQDVRAYYETRYTPDRVIVGIVGHVDPERALSQAADLYGGWRRPSAEVPPSPPEPDRPGPALRVLRGDIQRPLVAIGWRTVGTLHDDAAALDAAAVILGCGRGSRLYQAVRLPGLASAAQASHYTPTEVGVFEIGLEGDATTVDEAVTRALALAAELAADGPTAAELARVRALTATGWARRFEASDGRGTALCEAEALGDHRLVDELYRRGLDVSAADVRRVARRYLDPAAAGGVLYVRDGMSPRLEGATWPPAATHRSPVRAAWPPVVTATRRPAPDAVSQHAGGVGRRSVRGIDLLARAKPGSGLVTVGLVVPGVPGGESARTAGISVLLARTALRGAGGLSADALAGAAESLGGDIAPHVGTEVAGWWVTVRADAAAEAAELLRRVALEPTLDDRDVAVERALQASDARRARDDMFRHPIQRVLAHAFAGDPYGLPALGEPETVAALDPDDVRRWGAALSARRALAVVVGDGDAEVLLDALAPLEAWPGGADEAPEGAPAPWCASQGAESRAKAQTALAMAFPAVPSASPDRYPLVVLGALLSGLAGRLFDELRERRSLAYTVAALPWLARRGGAFLTYIATSPDREDEAREAMLTELARIRVEAVPEAELARARNYAAGTFEVRQQLGRSMAAEIADAWVLGTLDELPEIPGRLRAVDAADIARVTEPVLVADRRAEHVVRGSGVIGGSGGDGAGGATPDREGPART